MTESDKDFEPDYRTYGEQFDKAEPYFQHHISGCENKAFEYGIIVVKNAILIAGGGLLAIPAILGLSGVQKIDQADASIAGLSFASALIVAILGAYIVHINWTLHSAAWEKFWEERRQFFRDVYLEGKDWDAALEVEQASHFKKSINVTFWVPHLFALIYLVLVGYGFYRFYLAFGVFE